MATTNGFCFAATCAKCRGPLTVESITNARQTRRAFTRCNDCGRDWTITLSMARTATRIVNAPAAGPRLPWAPLARHLPPTQPDAAQRLGVSVDTVRSWRDDGITADAADRAAVAVGQDPFTIWGSAYYLACGEDEAA